jgi:hypothetical protein
LFVLLPSPLRFPCVSLAFPLPYLSVHFVISTNPLLSRPSFPVCCSLPFPPRLPRLPPLRSDAYLPRTTNWWVRKKNLGELFII